MGGAAAWRVRRTYTKWQGSKVGAGRLEASPINWWPAAAERAKKAKKASRVESPMEEAPTTFWETRDATDGVAGGDN